MRGGACDRTVVWVFPAKNAVLENKAIEVKGFTAKTSCSIHSRFQGANEPDVTGSPVFRPWLTARRCKLSTPG